MAAEMDARVQRVLAAYHRRAAVEHRRIAAGWILDERIDQLLLPVGPDTGRLMNILIKGAQARRILEIGTSYGYSTVWLAEAARATRGRVITLDVARYKQDYAGKMLQRAGLARRVEFRTGDALELLKGIERPIDFVLIDLWKDLYIPCFDLLVARLARGALIVADNMVEPASARRSVAAYRAHVRRRRDMESILLEVGSGIYVSRYKPGR